mmetsp:Transcript_7574/g.13671  ORF Transcript_7574/g.13671 Transcript_7574/m.13671 type:complete len:131 (-) Transcript_7574:268-660(-)
MTLKRDRFRLIKHAGSDTNVTYGFAPYLERTRFRRETLMASSISIRHFMSDTKMCKFFPVEFPVPPWRDEVPMFIQPILFRCTHTKQKRKNKCFINNEQKKEMSISEIISLPNNVFSCTYMGKCDWMDDP